LLGGELYAAPISPVETAVNVLTPVRTVPPLVTSGDFSPDGSRIVLLTYLNAYWAIGVRGALHAFAVPLQKQNEAVAVVSDGSAVIVGSEGLHSLVYEIPLPALSPPPSGPGASGQSQPQSRSPQQRPSRSAPSSAGAQSISPRPGAGDVKHERFPWFAVFIPVALALIGAGWAVVHRWCQSRRGSHIG